MYSAWDNSIRNVYKNEAPTLSTFLSTVCPVFSTSLRPANTSHIASYSTVKSSYPRIHTPNSNNSSF